MMEFDADVNSVDDFLADLEDEIDLHSPKWRFKGQVRELLKAHPERTTAEAEEIVETVIRTKCTDKRCACGRVADLFDPQDKTKIYCGRCWYAKTGRYNNG